MTTGDPVQLVAAFVRAAHPDAEVETERIQPRALSVPKYVFVKETGGVTPRPGRVDRPNVEVITYTRSSRSEGWHFAYQVLLAIREAWDAQTVVPGVGWITRLVVLQRPTYAQVEGVPAGVTRMMMTLAIDVRPD